MMSMMLGMSDDLHGMMQRFRLIGHAILMSMTSRNFRYLKKIRRIQLFKNISIISHCNHAEEKNPCYRMKMNACI